MRKIGKILEEEKNLLEAKKFYEKTLSLDINHKLANLFYGKILVKLNEHKKGLYHIHKASGIIRFNKNSYEII